MSKEEQEDHSPGKLPYNGYSDEFLDRLEPNGNIPEGKSDLKYGTSYSFFLFGYILGCRIFYVHTPIHLNAALTIAIALDTRSRFFQLFYFALRS